MSQAEHPEERARRRLAEMSARGESKAFEDVLAHQNERDRKDVERSVGPLRLAEDAIEVCTDGLGADEVVGRLEVLVRERMSSSH